MTHINIKTTNTHHIINLCDTYSNDIKLDVHYVTLSYTKSPIHTPAQKDELSRMMM